MLAILISSVMPGRTLTRLAPGGQQMDWPWSWNTSVMQVGQAGAVTLQGDGVLTVFDATTGTTRWSIPSWFTPIAATPEGGVAVPDGAGNLSIRGADGALVSSAPFSLSRPSQDLGDWIGLGTGTLESVVSTLPNATLFQASQFAQDLTGQRRQRKPGVGVFLKVHPVLWNYKHVGVRIVPADGSWITAASYPNFGTDSFGNKYVTLGAEQRENSLTCFGGTLFAQYNRSHDVAPPLPPFSFIRRLPIPEAMEVAASNVLRDRQDDFITHFNSSLSYNCWPETWGAYNSNSYAHGLLHAAAVQHDEAPPTPLPGWSTVVPVANFFPPQ